MRRCTPPKETSHGIFLSHSALPFGVSLGNTWSFTKKDIKAEKEKPTGKAASGSIRDNNFLPGGIPDRPMEQLPRFHGGTVTTQMRNLYRWGWWGKPLFRPNFVYKKTSLLPIFPQFGNHVTTNWCFQRSARFRHSDFAVFSVPGHLRCYIGAIFLCNSVLRTFHAQIFQTNQHNQWVFGIVRDRIQKALHL